jgi:CSLREA domain-containing protein
MNGFTTALARGVTSVLVLVTLAAGDGHAAEIAVTTFKDILDDFDGTCTLREAVRSANGDIQIDACEPGSGADRILLAAGTYRLNLVDGADEDEAFERDLDLRGSLVIRGASPEYTIADCLCRYQMSCC